MDAKEAVKYFKGVLFPSDMSASTLRAIAMNEAAIEALEKQVPKEPARKGIDVKNGDWIVECPCCGVTTSGSRIYSSFCPNCGQAIKRGDEE